MRQSIAEIEALLRTEDARVDFRFNPPATEEELAEAEKELDMKLPDDLRELYTIHNGQREGGAGLFFGLPFLPLGEMLKEWRIWAGLEEEWDDDGANHYSVPAGWIKERYINRGWLPISTDWGGNHLGVDLDPDKNGISGQVVNFGRDEEVKYVIARGIAQFIRFICEKVRSGDFEIHELDDDEVNWSLGTPKNTHFLDVIRSMELPVSEPIRRSSAATDAQVWLQGLDADWQKNVVDACGSPEAFLRAKQLLLIAKNIKDVAPLAVCAEVRELVLSANEIRSVEGLAGCVQLKSLYLAKNPLADLRPLSRLSYLQELVLSNTEVADLSPLSLLPELKILDAEHAPVRDFSPLKSVASFRVLKVANPTGDQLRSLSELRQLIELTIDGMDPSVASSIVRLGRLENLRTLRLEDASLPDLSFTRFCRKLRKVILVNTDVKDISALAELPELREIELSGCPDIGELKKLAGSASLKKATVSYPQFVVLKNSFDRYLDFSTMNGRINEEESRVWSDYLDRAQAANRPN